MHPKPIATYRLQLRKEFNFEDSIEIIPYLAQLGVSHLYTSPYLQSKKGSSHGYDVVDTSRVNDELGGKALHEKFSKKIQEEDLGQMIDIVPNHMSISEIQNPWWWDVLENGPSSYFATYFDVDWEASSERWPNKVHLPLLEEDYGKVLEKGLLKLSYKEGQFSINYKDHVFPVDPSSLSSFFSKMDSDKLRVLALSYAQLPRPTVTSRELIEKRHQEKIAIKEFLIKLCLEDPSIEKSIQTEVEHLNKDLNGLNDFLEEQNYSLAFWKTASRDLGYRRFFDVKDLIGLNIENSTVFFDTHKLPFTWIKNNWVQGLRVDHPDGLKNPTEYFTRLRAFCPDTWIVAEKILMDEEKLPSLWPIDGTTGYDFLSSTLGS